MEDHHREHHGDHEMGIGDSEFDYMDETDGMGYDDS